MYNKHKSVFCVTLALLSLLLFLPIVKAVAQEGGGAQGSATPAAGITITIQVGSSIQGNPDYQPDEAEVPLNDNIVWVNEANVPHTRIP